MAKNHGEAKAEFVRNLVEIETYHAKFPTLRRAFWALKKNNIVTMSETAFYRIWKERQEKQLLEQTARQVAVTSLDEPKALSAGVEGTPSTPPQTHPSDFKFTSKF
ncbi:hypothetical protein [Polycladidibacter hongkongensis]|uniref:hypothetical protein n=1 Tax=Polycladidibacter hongkongensis TaxID=1647556 RepID=UPI0008318280|nr:hypothetical protein [Pseudovibrio hongkongensis]